MSWISTAPLCQVPDRVVHRHGPELGVPVRGPGVSIVQACVPPRRRRPPYPAIPWGGRYDHDTGSAIDPQVPNSNSFCFRKPSGPAVPLNNSRSLPRTWGAVHCRGSAGVPICQGPGRVLDCRAKDLTKELPAMPLNTSRPLPRTWGSCPLPRISLCSSVPRIERACYSRACWRPGEWGCTPTPHAGELSIPA